MNLTGIIDLKERIALSDAFTPDERDFILECIALGVAQLRENATVAALSRRHTPLNHLARIDALWAMLSSDADGEGLCGAPVGPNAMVLPLIAADETRLALIAPWGRTIAAMSHKPVHLVKFSQRTDLKVFKP